MAGAPEATCKPLDQGLSSQYYPASAAETKALHHPLTMLTPVWLPSKVSQAPSQSTGSPCERTGTERIEASQRRATCPQIVLLLLWVVKLISNTAPENSPLMKFWDSETENQKGLQRQIGPVNVEEQRLRVRWTLSHVSKPGKGGFEQKLQRLCSPVPPGFRPQDTANTARRREWG